MRPIDYVFGIGLLFLAFSKFDGFFVAPEGRVLLKPPKTDGSLEKTVERLEERVASLEKKIRRS